MQKKEIKGKRRAYVKEGCAKLMNMGWTRDQAVRRLGVSLFLTEKEIESDLKERGTDMFFTGEYLYKK